MPTTPTLNDIQSAYSDKRYETARRLCHVALQSDLSTSDRNAMLRLLHDAERILGDFNAAKTALEKITPTSPEEALDVALTLAADINKLSEWGYFRRSVEDKAGFTIDEYTTKYNALAREQFKKAIGLARTPDQIRAAAAAIRKAKYDDLLSLMTIPAQAAADPVAVAPAVATGVLAGSIRFPDGKPVADTTVVLGLPVDYVKYDLTTYFSSDMGTYLGIGDQKSISARTNSAGEFEIKNVPVSVHPFLAVVLPSADYDISTRFVAQNIEVKANATTRLDLTASEWKSVPARPVANSFPHSQTRGSSAYTLVHSEVLKNPFHYAFPRQAVSFKLPPGVVANPNQLLLLSSASDQAQPFQLLADELVFFTDLPAQCDKVFALYYASQSATSSFVPVPDLAPVPESTGHTAVIDTGRSCFKVVWGHVSGVGAGVIPPIASVKGMDGLWRGHGRLILPVDITVVSRSTRVTQSGPLVLNLTVDYVLSNKSHYTLNLTFHRDEAYVLVHEISPDIANAAFEFSLKEFTGGRGFLHWTPEHGNIHWTTLEAQDVEVARLQESVPWWIPPAGFAYAMTQGSMDSADYVSVFTIKRGDWIDRKFQAISQGPGDEPAWRRELEWPYPEMVGSTLSMITAHTSADADAYFRFGLFDGERHWGLLVSTLERNDGPFKELSSVQHKNSSPRLQDFKDWHLDEPDSHARPHVVAKRDELRSIRKKKDSPSFAKAWNLIDSGKIPGPALGVRFAVDGDPLVAWRKKIELLGVAGLRVKMTLLGRDFGDMYSPVGARPITQWAEDYDLIAASGCFTPDEERLVRGFLMVMAHMYMETDLMNWKYGARNANFEADRVDVVGAVGLCFDGNPDSVKFVKHSVDLMEKSINVYCTPGSGKWYENPACYYFQALKCRMNLAYHLATHGHLDPTSIPRLKDFLRWGVLLLTPACPIEHDVMRDGTGTQPYLSGRHVRRVAPIGDHAQLGTAVPEHFALMAKLYRSTDPEFADLLLWAYQSCDSLGGHYSNLPLYFCAMNEADVAPAPTQQLISRRLEGFGAVFRGDFNKPDSEFFLLLKQGPAGYRYHRTEGSIILFADGKPLIYDGGEAGETWRHTTLSFHDVQLPMSAGHVEKFHSFNALDFTQGVHPVIINPGEPVYLNDVCNHELVDVAFQRYAEPNPAVVRSVFWVKNEYVILHDALNIAPTLISHWHMQVVADGQTGDAQRGFVFKGRFGTDLQLLLPGQRFREEKIEKLPILDYQRKPEDTFAMQHLRLEGDAPKHYLAVIRPLGKRTPVASSACVVDGVTIGVNVTGDGINDHVFFSRAGTHFTQAGVSFTGTHGSILRRKTGTELILLGKGEINAGDVRIKSDGPAVHLSLTTEGTLLSCDGPGTVVIFSGQKPIRVNVPSGRTQIDLSAMIV